jgi:hypothetical protein
MPVELVKIEFQLNLLAYGAKPAHMFSLHDLVPDIIINYNETPKQKDIFSC